MGNILQCEHHNMQLQLLWKSEEVWQCSCRMYVGGKINKKVPKTKTKSSIHETLNLSTSAEISKKQITKVAKLNYQYFLDNYFFGQAFLAEKYYCLQKMFRKGFFG